MTAFKRILAATLAYALLMALPAPALAENWAARVDGDGATVYDIGGDAIGSLPADARLTVTAVKGRVCQINYNGKTGYMKKSDLVKETAVTIEKTMSKIVYVKRDGAVVYDKNGNAVGKLDVNTEVTVTAVKGKRCKISVDGKTGYMKKSDLSESRVAAQATQETAAEAAQTASKTAFVSKDDAVVYDKNGKAVGKLDLNTQVTVTAVKGKRCKISVDGKTGYMKKADLSENKTETAQVMNKTAYVNKDAAKVYNSKGKVIAGLSLNTAVTVTAVSGKLCKIYVGGNTGYMNAEDLSSKKTSEVSEAAETASSSATPARGTAKEMDWWTSGIQRIFAKGAVAIVTDVETGLAWREQRRGGTNHADVQPLTAADTAALKQAYGGTWSWTRRAIFVTIDGVNYAASMNGMPHGGGNITDNNFSGHHCIHFTNSRTHSSNRICSLHQAAIQKALQATL